MSTDSNSNLEVVQAPSDLEGRLSFVTYFSPLRGEEVSSLFPHKQTGIKMEGSGLNIIPFLLPEGCVAEGTGLIRAFDGDGAIYTGFAALNLRYTELSDFPTNDLIKLAWKPILPKLIKLISLYAGEGR